VALLGVVRLGSLRILPTFLRFGVRIERQLRRTPGVVAYRTGADLLNLNFYHLSAWTDLGAIQEFVDTAPHLLAVERLSGRLGETSFRHWIVRGKDLPMRFRHELHRLGN
jgi:hypothetical protein